MHEDGDEKQKITACIQFPQFSLVFSYTHCNHPAILPHCILSQKLVWNKFYV